MSESVEVVRQKEIVTRMRELNSKVIAERDALAAELADFRSRLAESCGHRIVANDRIAKLESALRKIQQWDMLNPLNGDYVFCDGPWLKKLVNDALAPSETDCAFCDGNGHEAQKICVHCDGSGKQSDRGEKR